MRIEPKAKACLFIRLFACLRLRILFPSRQRAPDSGGMGSPNTPLKFGLFHKQIWNISILKTKWVSSWFLIFAHPSGVLFSQLSGFHPGCALVGVRPGFSPIAPNKLRRGKGFLTSSSPVWSGVLGLSHGGDLWLNMGLTPVGLS